MTDHGPECDDRIDTRAEPGVIIADVFADRECLAEGGGDEVGDHEDRGVNDRIAADRGISRP